MKKIFNIKRKFETKYNHYLFLNKIYKDKYYIENGFVIYKQYDVKCVKQYLLLLVKNILINII